MSTTLVAFVVVVGTAHLAAYYTDRRAVAGVLKALPILALAWAAWTTPVSPMSAKQIAFQVAVC